MTHKQEVDVWLRQAEESDARAILGLLQMIQMESPYVVLDWRQGQVADQVALIHRYGQEDRALMLVAEVDGQLVGFATLSPFSLPEQAHVAEIGVCLIAEYWGYGIGSMLLESLMDYAQEVGLGILHLEVMADNLPARGLYQKFGFQECGRLSKRVQKQGRYYDTLIMEYRLDTPSIRA